MKGSRIGDLGDSSLEHPRLWLGSPDPTGWASLWECLAAQSHQARPQEAQGASWRGLTAKGDTLTMLPHSHYIWLQPPLHMVTASATYGYSLHYIWLQPSDTLTMLPCCRRSRTTLPAASRQTSTKLPSHPAAPRGSGAASPHMRAHGAPADT